MKTKEVKDNHKIDKIKKWQKRYLDLAFTVASWSSAVRKKVEAVVVKDNRVISVGYNGLLSGIDGSCEDENGLTKITCYHAECNSILTMCREGISPVGATMYITCSPCLSCAALIAGVKIKEVYYSELYKDDAGIKFLKLANIKIKQI